MRKLIIVSLILMTAFRPRAKAEGSLPYAALSSLTNRYAIASVFYTGSTLTWTAPDLNLLFTADSRRLEFNDTLIWLNSGIRIVSNRWMISTADAESVLAPLIRPAPLTHAPNRVVVVLDPGHGGNDPGALGPGSLTEKMIVLDIARRIRRKLTAEKITVRITRSIDRTLSLSARTELAARWTGDVFVSIHANKAANPSAKGIETFVLPATGFPATSSTLPVSGTFPGNSHDALNMQLAHAIHRELLNHTAAPDRGIKRARFEVLKAAPCPAVLLEVGFLSNTDDVRKLSDPVYRDTLAEGITCGILVFLRGGKLPEDVSPATAHPPDPGCIVHQDP